MAHDKITLQEQTERIVDSCTTDRMVLLLQTQVQRICINVTIDIVYGIKDKEALPCLPKTTTLQE